jgi:hypothetical protein
VKEERTLSQLEILKKEFVRSSDEKRACVHGMLVL